jgi:uncharacterized protein YuzE
VSIQIGDREFEHATYDETADVLYLRIGDLKEAASTLGTTEGHAVRFDGSGNIIGITIVNARWLLERDGEIALSIPGQRIEAPAADLSAALEHSIKK